MEAPFSSACRLFAEAFRYPAPGHLATLEQGLQALPPGDPKQYLASFLEVIRPLTLGEWEELHTRTLDMNPPAAPYIGFQTWGESYQRGAFLSKMSREILDAGVDTDGELPDHLIPVLRYLAQVEHPLAELVEIMGPAIQRMVAALRKVDTANPYLFLLEGALSLSKSVPEEAV